MHKKCMLLYLHLSLSHTLLPEVALPAIIKHFLSLRQTLELPSSSIWPRLRILELSNLSPDNLPTTLGTWYKVDSMQVIQSYPYLIYLDVFGKMRSTKCYGH